MVDYSVLDVNRALCTVDNIGGIGRAPVGNSGLNYLSGTGECPLLKFAGFWILGKINNEVRSAVYWYPDLKEPDYVASEFQPGIILSDGSPDDPNKEEYKVYKYNKGDMIDPIAIAQGCPQEVLGDQMIYCVFNDLRSNEHMCYQQPIGLEVHLTAWGYDIPGPLENTIFLNYQVNHKGLDTLKDAYLAFALDPDIGNGNDDYTGCDTVLDIGYAFNGDGHDSICGVIIPSLAAALIQGTSISDIGSTSLNPDDMLFKDNYRRHMSAYFFHVFNSYGITCGPWYNLPGDLYHFCSGFLNNGDSWVDPTNGNKPTNFPFAGDPVKGTGWLLSSISRPKNILFGISSGPFDLDIGESQEVTIALVVGQGSDYLNSITVMKQYSIAAKQAYWRNFEPQEAPPEPHLTVSELENELVLMWDDTAVGFKEYDYIFEGYNIWQGESENGPWTRIATLDRINGITTIWDYVSWPSNGAMIHQPVQWGEDGGVETRFRIDQDYIREAPLTNGRSYFYAVTAYAYNPDGVPKVLESEKQCVTAVPHRPLLDVEYNSEAGASIPVFHAGQSQGQLFVEVADPIQITGDDYDVTFFIERDSTSDYFKETGYRLTNTTNGEILLERFDQTVNAVNPVVEGLLVNVLGPEPDLKTVVQVANPAYPEGLPEEQWDGTGMPYSGNCVWLSLSCPDDSNHNGRYYWSYDGDYADELTSSHDFEVRWKDGITDYSWMVWPWENSGMVTGKVPFELWDIGLFTPDDVSDDIRMIPVSYCYENTPGVFDLPSGDMTENYWGYPCSDRIYFYYPDGENGDKTYQDFHTACEAGAMEEANACWGSSHSPPLQCLVVVNYTSIDHIGAPAAGSVDRFITNKPNSPGDRFFFSTKNHAPTKSADVAKERLKDIQVYPNPYFNYNDLEPYYGGQFVTFNNLPEECAIRVFSLSGILVRTLEHNSGTPFERWDLQNESEKHVASGMYIVHIDTEFGDRMLKLAVINRAS